MKRSSVKVHSTDKEVELAGERIRCMKEHSNVERLISWMDMQNRPLAVHYFPMGPEQRIAYAFERNNRRDDNIMPGLFAIVLSLLLGVTSGLLLSYGYVRQTINKSENQVITLKRQLDLSSENYRIFATRLASDKNIQNALEKENEILSDMIRRADYALENGQVQRASRILNGE